MANGRRPESAQPRFVLRHFVGTGRASARTYATALDTDAQLAHHCTVVYERVERCPRCDQLVQQEPAACVCRWGCGRIWRIVGASTSEQYEFERASGLIGTVLA